MLMYGKFVSYVLMERASELTTLKSGFLTQELRSCFSLPLEH